MRTGDAVLKELYISASEKSIHFSMCFYFDFQKKKDLTAI